MFKIKVLMPNSAVEYMYVKSIKRGSKAFEGTTDIDAAKTYTKTNSVNALLAYFLEQGVNYVLLDVQN